MKLFLLSSALLATLVAANTYCSNTVCQDYAVHAGTLISFADGVSAKTMISGDIGVSPADSITGVNEGYMEFTSGEIASTETSAAFAAGVNAAHAAAMDDPGETIDGEIGWSFFLPGTYNVAAAMSFSTGFVVLDGLGDENAVFLFQVGTTLTTAANTFFILDGGARAENVLFALGSAATLGEDSLFEGSIIAGTSVTVGTGAQVNGCIVAKAAVTFAGRGSVDNLGSALTWVDVLENCIEAPASSPTSSHGDPHFRTWKNEHFEYHGQCDLVLAKDPEFAEGLGLDVQIRTKLVRFWSYIKQAAVRIGDDILEIEGSADPTDIHYWINLEYKGELKTLGGFPVTTFVKESSSHQRFFEIDLSSKYPGVKIVLGTYKEFVSVEFVNSSEVAFGKAVGLFGDFKTGKTFARDGFTVLDDFTELGHEWQVLPAEVMIFHDISEPQFPQMCIDPEDPRGERRRRLDESFVTEEQAEAACARIPDAADRKDCVYDILATQDIDMVGAY